MGYWKNENALEPNAIKIALLGCCPEHLGKSPRSMTTQEALNLIFRSTFLDHYSERDVLFAAAIWSGQDPQEKDPLVRYRHLIQIGCTEKFRQNCGNPQFEYGNLLQLAEKGGVPLQEALVRCFPQAKRASWKRFFLSLRRTFGIALKPPPIAYLLGNENTRRLLTRYPHLIARVAWMVWVEESHEALKEAEASQPKAA
jgi:hypothetical protein